MREMATTRQARHSSRASCLGWALALVCAFFCSLVPTRGRAQAWGGEIAAASALTGIEAGIGTWILSMPWGGFWASSPQPDDGWSIAGGLAAAGLVSTGSFFVTRGHPERAELVAVVSGAGLALSAAVAFFGGVWALMSDYDRLAFSLVFGVPALASAVIALLAGVVHLAIEGDASTVPAPLVAPLSVCF